jgi:hypothetical protein
MVPWRDIKDRVREMECIIQRTGLAIDPDESGDENSLPYLRAELQYIEFLREVGWDLLRSPEYVAALHADFRRLSGRQFDRSKDSIAIAEADTLPIKRPPSPGCTDVSGN